MSKRKYGSRSARLRQGYKWSHRLTTRLTICLVGWLVVLLAVGSTAALPVALPQLSRSANNWVVVGDSGSAYLSLGVRVGASQREGEVRQTSVTPHTRNKVKVRAKRMSSEDATHLSETQNLEAEPGIKTHGALLRRRNGILAARAEKGGSSDKKKSSSSKSSNSKKEEPAGKAPAYQLMIGFVGFLLVAGAGVWYHHNKKMLHMAEQRRHAARKLREQEWEREAREIPDPEADLEADQNVENLPYAPEGLFYDTGDPAEILKEADIADQEWDDTSVQQKKHHHHHRHKQHHHKEHHSRYREADERSIDSRNNGRTAYERSIASTDSGRTAYERSISSRGTGKTFYEQAKQSRY